MKRGDVVVVAATGDCGKPRPAVVVQTNAFPETHASVVICQMTSEVVEAPDFRVAIDPCESNGLRAPAQIMADKPVTVRRARVGRSIGRLDERDVPRPTPHRRWSWGLGIEAASGFVRLSEQRNVARGDLFHAASDSRSAASRRPVTCLISSHSFFCRQPRKAS